MIDLRIRSVEEFDDLHSDNSPDVDFWRAVLTAFAHTIADRPLIAGTWFEAAYEIGKYRMHLERLTSRADETDWDTPRQFAVFTLIDEINLFVAWLMENQ